MGVIENKYYDSGDVCGKTECNRAARDAEQWRRNEAHDQLDRDRDWDGGWY